MGNTIDSYTLVTTPAGTDMLICTQGGVTRKQSVTQLRSVVSPAASTVMTGLIEIATDAETTTGTETGLCITPSNLKTLLQALAYKLVMNGAAIDMAKGADIASAASVDIGAATGNYLEMTGSVIVSALGTANTGLRRTVIPKSSLPFEYNATRLVIPGSSSITALVGDVVEFLSLGGGNWRMTDLIPRTRRLLAGMSINGTFSRNLADASGIQSVTAIGFKPSYIIIFACVGGTNEVSWGFGGGGGENAIYKNTTTSFSNAGQVIRLVETDVSVMNTGAATMNDDGFTITWTKTGSPTGTATMQYLAFS